MAMNSTENNVVPEMPDATPVATKLAICEVCSCNAVKYTCPRCEVKTCCLRCVQIHKQELDCSGERDRTKFIPLKKFTNLDLSSDYRLLEEITRNVETLKKNRTKIHKGRHEILPRHLYKLRKAASLRQTFLKFLPQNFEKHKKNGTRLHSNVLFWRIDWIFANADNLKLSDHVPETAKLSNLLYKYLDKQEDRLLQEKLQYYQAANLSGIKVYLKAEQKAGCKYYEIDLLASLKDNLKNKIIIEYPTIHVVLKEHADLYNVVDSDNETEDMDVGNGKEVVNRIIKKAEEDDSVHHSLKNLLFISEQSDEEISDVER